MVENGQTLAPQLVSHRLLTIYTLDENCGIWIPTTIIRRTPNIIHRRASAHYVGQVTVVGDAVEYYIKENYKTDFEIWNKSSKLQSERKNIEMSQPPLDSIPVGAKNPDKKTPATDSSARKYKRKKRVHTRGT